VDVPDFQKAFRDGETFHTSYLGEFHVERREIGQLVVPTGRLVACDPLVFPETRPFRKLVPAGRYPVVLSIAHIPPPKGNGPPDQRIACAMLCLGRRVPRRWQMAVKTGQRLRGLKPDEFYGYPVDSGTGCFMDLKAAGALDRRMRDDPDYFERLIKAAKAVYVHTRDWADFQLEAETGLNVVFFSSGFGDGTYPSYWGYDGAGGLACLVTDFRVLTREGAFEEVTEIAEPGAAADGGRHPGFA
jgi:Protein of unknown function (DUF4241)